MQRLGLSWGELEDYAVGFLQSGERDTFIKPGSFRGTIEVPNQWCPWVYGETNRNPHLRPLICKD